jgi:hypothetical protein
VQGRWFTAPNGMRIFTSEEEIERGIATLKEQHETDQRYRKAALDPNAPYSNPDAHSTSHNVTPRWQPSVPYVRKFKEPDVKVSYLPRKNEFGLTVQPGIADSSYVDVMAEHRHQKESFGS